MRWPTLVLLLCVGFGCGGHVPKYCDDCQAIWDAQNKPDKTREDFERLKLLKERYNDKAESLAVYAQAANKPVDPHLECECECHRRTPTAH